MAFFYRRQDDQTYWFYQYSTDFEAQTSKKFYIENDKRLEFFYVYALNVLVFTGFRPSTSAQPA